MKRSRYLLAFAVLALGACSTATESTDTGSEASSPPASEVESGGETPDTEPAISAGAVSTGAVEIDGVSIDYVTSVPEGFEIGDDAPLLLAFPAGGQSLDTAESLVEGTYASEAQRLGWVVVSPAAPDGELFFEGSETLVPGFVDWIETWVEVEGGAPHVAGVSNGGISTFRYAALNPDRVQSMVVFPGFPRSSEDQEALSGLSDVPVRLYVGGDDDGWVEPAEEATGLLEEAGGDVELTIFEGEGHIMDSTRDGTVIFEQLESFR